MKLPAYGRRLLNARASGRHPLCVHLIFGIDWRAPTRCGLDHVRGEHPLIALRPQAYAPGEMDFRLIAGVRVVIFDQTKGIEEFDCRGGRYKDFGHLFELASEIAHWAGRVEIVSAGRRIEIDLLAEKFKTFPDRLAMKGTWPSWWSEELSEDYGRRASKWIEVAAALAAG